MDKRVIGDFDKLCWTRCNNLDQQGKANVTKVGPQLAKLASLREFGCRKQPDEDQIASFNRTPKRRDAPKSERLPWRQVQAIAA